MGCNPWGHEESDRTERLHFQFSLSCIGEGNGNPLQCSCLENPRDGGAWWAAVYGVTQSRTRLKQLSSSSSSSSAAIKAESCFLLKVYTQQYSQILPQDLRPPLRKRLVPSDRAQGSCYHQPIRKKSHILQPHPKFCL